MIPYQKEKIENAICFFASEHKKKARDYLYQTFLYKYLAFFDFDSLQDTGQPALGLTYKAMEKGPVPIEIFENREVIKSECYRFVNLGENKYIIEPIGKPNLDYFSEYEIELLKRLIIIFADKFVKTNEISEASHQSIKAWRKAYKLQKNSIIDLKQHFDDKLLEKDEKDLSFAEQGFLIYLGLEVAC